MRWIDSTDLKQWADRRGCQELLPLVVRKLIRATVASIDHISFPAGDSVQRGGWDGQLGARVKTEYIPKGSSFWEFSVRDKIKNKANEDYEKRTGQADATFIFVTARIFEGKKDWCDEKNKEKKWREVKFYDADNLEEWIEQAPAVGAWLARYLNKFAENGEAAEDYWAEWTASTRIPITSKLILSGRQEEAIKIGKWINSSPSQIIVQSESVEESIVFLIATTDALPQDVKEHFFSRCLITDDIQAFRRAVACANKLILVNNFYETDAIGKAVQDGHHVYFPIGPDSYISKADIILPRFAHVEFISALEEIGVSEIEAQRYSRETGRSLTVLKRRISDPPELPDWGRQESARDLIPALFIQGWNEQKDADKEAICEIAGEEYNAVVGKMMRWLRISDSPLRKIGSSWRLTSPMDAWFALAQYLSAEDLQSFKTVALKILQTVDPSYDLEPEKRYMASLYHKEMPYSKELREGIANSLMLVAVFGVDSGLKADELPQNSIDQLVCQLLHKADWKLWSSLSNILPLIAEASPNSFLEQVDLSLSDKKPEMMGMFTETEDVLFSSSAHTGLLWALEGLAWDPLLLCRVALILAKLSRLDPGGKLDNRPANSLHNIFLLWKRYTFANHYVRMSVLDTLLEREPEVAWKLLIALIPASHEFSMGTHKPRWRQFSERPELTITRKELTEDLNSIIDKILAHAGSDGDRWFEIIERIPDMPFDIRQRTLKLLGSTVNSIENNRNKVWKALRSILSRHRSFPDADWTLPEDELKLFEGIYNDLVPPDIYERYLWLFDFSTEIPEGSVGKNYKEKEELINSQRLNAIQEIRREEGIEGIVNLAKKVEDAWVLGICIGQIDLETIEEERIFSLLNLDNDEESLKFVSGYVHWCGINKGDEWIDSVIKTAMDKAWNNGMIVNFLIYLPENSRIWEKLATFDSTIQDEYWRKCRALFYHVSKEEKEFGIKRLLSVERAYTSLRTSAIIVQDLSSELLLEVLQKAATTSDKTDDPLPYTGYDVIRLLGALHKSDEIDDTKMAQLEWLYLPIIADDYSEYSPRRLHNELSTNPSFFADIVRFAFKRREAEEHEESKDLSKETIINRARQAYRLLSSWKTVPGRAKDGKLDYNILEEWVIEARKLCDADGRGIIGDQHIGQVFAHAKVEDNNDWPPEPICKIIQSINSKELEKGFLVGILNKRGATSRQLDEGGAQERELANLYRKYSEKLSSNFPAAASVLLKVAENYEKLAKSEDNEAQRRDLEY